MISAYFTFKYKTGDMDHYSFITLDSLESWQYNINKIQEIVILLSKATPTASPFATLVPHVRWTDTISASFPHTKN